MRKLIIMGLMAATILPVTAASAQSAGEIRRDRRELQEERRELRDAQRYGTRRDVREERRDVREARRELREDIRDRRDWGRNDWRGYRQSNRALYRRGAWRAPFRYTTFRPGLTVRPIYYSPRYIVADPWRYRLPRANGNLRWVRHYDDVLLVNIRTGRIVDVIRGFYW